MEEDSRESSRGLLRDSFELLLLICMTFVWSFRFIYLFFVCFFLLCLIKLPILVTFIKGKDTRNEKGKANWFFKDIIGEVSYFHWISFK